MDDATNSRRWLFIVPNVFTVLRLVLAVSFPWMPTNWRVGVIIIAGVSDFIDGFLARRYALSSWIGGLLDAVADKGFVLVVLITLAIDAPVAWWQVLLVLSRDIAVLGIVIFVAARGRWDAFRKMPSRWPGKWATGAIFLWMVVLLLWPAQRWMVLALFILAASLSMVAAVDYLLTLRRELNQENASSADDQS